MTQIAADTLTSALALHRAGQLPQAEAAYRQILAQNPGHADACHLLGALCLQSGRAAEAVELITRAIAINPGNADYYNHLGAAYGALAEHDQAVSILRRAVQIAPHSDSAHYNLGTALRNQGKLEEAVVSFRHAIAANPASAEAHYNLANALRDSNRLDEAEASYRQALGARPRYLKAIINLGAVVRDQGRLEEAIEILRQAVSIDARYSNAHLNLGTALRDAGHYAEAVACFHQALALLPDLAEAHNNLGTTLQAQGRLVEALACYEEALRCDSLAADAHFNLGTYRLRQGDLEGGFPEYEWRWKFKNFSSRRYAEPRWDGSQLEGRTILLHAEQGLGDTLQFIRYASDVKDRGATVLVECQAPLLNILASCPGIDRLIAVGSPLPSFDVQASLLSLPSILKLSLENLSRGAYLCADPALVEQWHADLEGYRGFRIGICWQGNPKFLFDRQRSLSLEQFGPLAEIAGVRLVSLQKGTGAEQIAANDGFEVIDLGPGWDEAAGPFMDTAAVMKNLDLVITADTAVAHLAGALGVPVWLALAINSDWRWFADREDSPWYPTMRLFRQQRLDDWSDVFGRIAHQLQNRIAGRD
ncbi:MAG: tetratricopeptide repeat protein [Planctomycetia bacterium]|nr:tetratricopeptide repeat protein [Planctomycetia bacterium]